MSAKLIKVSCGQGISVLVEIFTQFDRLNFLIIFNVQVLQELVGHPLQSIIRPGLGIDLVDNDIAILNIYFTQKCSLIMPTTWCFSI